MKRRKILNAIPAFLAALFLGKKVQAEDDDYIKFKRYSDAHACGYVVFTDTLIEKARKGDKSAIESINQTYETNKNALFEKLNINPKEGTKQWQHQNY